MPKLTTYASKYMRYVRNKYSSIKKRVSKQRLKKLVSKVLTKSIISIILRVSNQRNESFDTKEI